MKKLLALAMLLVLCTVLTGLLTGCKVSVANTMMTDGVPKVAVTSPDVPVISTEWTERQYTVSEQDETVLLTARYQIPVLTLTGSPDNSDTAAKNRQAAVQRINDWFTDWRDQQLDMLDEMEQMAREEYEITGGERWKAENFAYRDEAGISWWQNERLLCVTLSYVSYTGGAHPSTWRQAVSFDLSTGKTVSVTDLATDINQLEEAVYQLILRQIQDSGDTSYFSDYDKTVLDWIERSVFYNADGATIVFNTYDIAPYSAGEQTFFIPYDLVKPYLNDYGLHLLELDT